MEDGWFVKRGSQRQGPLTGKQLIALAAQGDIQPTDRMARKGMAKWVQAKTIEGLFVAAPPARSVAAPLPPPVPGDIVLASAIEEPAVTPAKPAAPAQPAAMVAKRSPVPWIVAGTVGSGVILLGCSGLLCTGVLWLASGSADSQAVPEFSNRVTAYEAQLAATQTVKTQAAETQAPEIQSSMEANSGDAGDELAVLQSALESLQNRPGTSLPAGVPELAALLAQAEAGDVEAMDDLADRYADGLGVAEDDVAAVQWYQKAADAGSGDAMSDLAYMYVKGEGVAEDHATAAAWFAKGAEAGSGVAMFNYAICLGNGTGVAQNEFVSRQWIQKSAEAGYEPAQKWMREAQTQIKANILSAIVGGMFGGGGDDNSGGQDDQQRYTERRREKEYWEDRARQSEAAGNQADADYARRNVP